MKRFWLLVFCAAAIFLLAGCSNSAQTYKYEHEMTDAVCGNHWNLSTTQGVFDKQISVYYKYISFVDNNGNETYSTIKEWDHKNGKIITDDGREFVIMKSGNIREGKQEYKRTEDVVESTGDKIYDKAIDLYSKNGSISFYGRQDDRDNKNYSIASEIIEILETLPDGYIRYGEQSKQEAIQLVKNVRDSQFPGDWEYKEWDDYGSYIFRVSIHSNLRAQSTRYGSKHDVFYGELWLTQDCYTTDGEYFWTPESGTKIPFDGNSKFKMNDGNLVVIDGGYAWTAYRYSK